MDSNELRYSLNEGKYELVFNQLTGEFKCLRYGKHWRDLAGDKMVLALMQAVLGLEDAVSDKSAKECNCSALGHDAAGTIKCVYCGSNYTIDQDGKYVPVAGQPTQHTTGVYNKFTVYRNDGRDKPGGDRHGAQYFVLDVTHDKFAPAALIAYANACTEEYPALANDLINCVQHMDEILK